VCAISEELRQPDAIARALAFAIDQSAGVGAGDVVIRAASLGMTSCSMLVADSENPSALAMTLATTATCFIRQVAAASRLSSSFAGFAFGKSASAYDASAVACFFAVLKTSRRSTCCSGKSCRASRFTIARTTGLRAFT
jgi:hypothetical protein